jgi:phenylpropionate dioxygenase-like ring-hydroxylating dioxygenase large terminal subunit
MHEFPALKNYWYIACRSNKLRNKPLKFSLLGKPIVLFRAAAGKASALRDLCPHRNAPLSSGRLSADRIVCPYHGWQFDGDGICRLVPGLDGEHHHQARNAVRYHVREQQGFVWVYGNPDETPCREPYGIPYLDAAGFRSIRLEFPLAAELPDALENLLDTTHTHFVHRGIIRSENKRRKTVVLVRGFADRAEAEYVADGQDSGVMARLFGGGVDTSIDRFLMPSIVELEHLAKGRVKLLVSLAITPESDASLRVHVVASGPSGVLRHIQALTLGKLIVGRLIRQDYGILRQQLLNKRAHESARYASTNLDLLRPYIMRLLKKDASGPADKTAPAERRVEIVI